MTVFLYALSVCTALALVPAVVAENVEFGRAVDPLILKRSSNDAPFGARMLGVNNRKKIKEKVADVVIDDKE
jgi:hypothetical protein